jgi:deoxyribodipyrimidine photo-lyase
MSALLTPATRPEALRALGDFVDGPVLRYARLRNHIADGHSHVSRLSAAITHRLVTEEEVLRAVLRVHKPAAVEKFLQEVVWRSYWKGWLELRPGVWRDFVDFTPAAEPLAERLRAGRSGCEAMDAFARELVSTGYLHNHARMWWASFWIHRAGLPWRDGARFFLDHLLDADAASNTLSWRWVAGLQTAGKTYLVRRSNLETYWPDAPGQGLNQLEGEPAIDIPRDTADRSRHEIAESVEHPGVAPAGLLLHEEDLSLECGPLRDFRPAAVQFWKTPSRSSLRAAWLRLATEDACSRAESHFQREVTASETLNALQGWVETQSLRRIVMAAPFVGPVRDSLAPFLAWCADRGIAIVPIRRRWDSRVFPLAKAGFFPFWNSVRPQLTHLAELSE